MGAGSRSTYPRMWKDLSGAHAVSPPKGAPFALKLAGAAWDKINSDAYRATRLAWFRKPGCLLAYDGSEDHWVQPQGLPGYQPPPPGTWEEEWDESEPEDESGGEEGDDDDDDGDL